MTHVNCDLLALNKNELMARMMCTDIATTLSLAEQCEDDVRAAADCFYSFQKTGVQIVGDTVNLGFGDIKSAALARNLSGCGKAYVAAVSLGHGVDRLLRKVSVMSASRHFVTDAVASTLAEALCDHVQSALPQKTKTRFSPGYGDLPLAVQAPLLQFLGNTGITLTDSGLMIPSKSVTFIVGIVE